MHMLSLVWKFLEKHKLFVSQIKSSLSQAEPKNAKDQTFAKELKILLRSYGEPTAHMISLQVMLERISYRYLQI